MRYLHRDSVALILLLAMLTAMGPLSTDMYLASLPAIGRAFGADAAEVQLTLSLYLAGFALSQLVYGPLADRFGRRRLLLGGMAIYTVASLACALAPSMTVLLVARFVQALGGCAGPVLGRAIVRDLHTRDKAARMLAYMGLAMGFAPLLAPILGSYLQVWYGWQANFFVLVAAGALNALLIWQFLGESLKTPDLLALQPRRMLRNYSSLLRSRVYLGYALTCCFCYSGLFCFISLSSYVLIETFGVPSQYFGYLFAGCGFGYMMGNVIAGKLTMRLGIDGLLIHGTRLSLLAGVLMAGLAFAHVDHIAAVVLPMMLFTLSLGIVLPQSLAGAISPFPQMAGVASALLGFLQMGIAAAVSALVGHWHDGTQVPMTTAIGLMGVLTFVSYVGLIRRRRVDPASDAAANV